MMRAVAAVWPRGMSGVIELSAIHRPRTPRTWRFGSTTARAPLPIRQDPTG